MTRPLKARTFLNTLLALSVLWAQATSAATSTSKASIEGVRAGGRSNEIRRLHQDSKLRLGQLQFLGSHNSYKLALHEEVMHHYSELDPADAVALDYAHAPLTEQLDIGLRQLELDVFYDPDGGLYAKPLGEQWAKQPTTAHDPNGELSQPGFKVLHKPDVDYRSTCLVFITCLKEIRAWSDAHPGHAPIIIAMNTKDEGVEVVHGGTVPKKFDPKAFQELENEILSVLPKVRLITPAPDRIPGKSNSGKFVWPTLAEARDKVMFFIDEPVETWKPYFQGRPHAAERIFFVASRRGQDQPGYASIPNPIKHFDEIKTLIDGGWLVRVMTEQATAEPRTGNLTRAQIAFKVGAQFVSTDYYYQDMRLGPDYRISQVPGGGTLRCNPVTAPDWCDDTLLDPYSPLPVTRP